MNILVYSSNENSRQNALAQHAGSEHVSHDEESGTYDLIVLAKYPHTYKRNGNQSVCGMLVTQEQYDFIESLNSSVEILAIDDNDPNTDYQWLGGSSENKFKSVVGNDFFTGYTIDIGGETVTIPARKKLAILA